jgi:O-antigen/teichoic acid export membrane protein
MREISRELWMFSSPRALATAFGVTITYLDVLLVGAFVSTKQAAIYAAVSRLSVVGNYALQGIRTAIAPQVSELIARREMTRLEGLYQVSTWWAMAMCFPVYIGFAVFAPIVTRLFGHAYGHGSPALVILCLAGLVNAGTGGVTLILLMAGNSRLNLLNTAAALALNVGLNVILIPRLGISGAAIAWGASILLSNLAALLQVHWITGVRPFGRGYWIVTGSTVGAFGLFGLAVRWALGATGPALVIAAMGGSVLYGGCLWLARETLALSSLRALLRQGRRRGAAGAVR